MPGSEDEEEAGSQGKGLEPEHHGPVVFIVCKFPNKPLADGDHNDNR